MSNGDDNFDFAPNMEEPVNAFKVVHVYNKSSAYHLTRQVLLDSALTQNTYCFFYHILSKNIEDFNEMYGSFACLFYRNEYEADLYLNTEKDALAHIIKYVQTGKINGEKIYSQNWRMIDEIIDLATMFGMPNLVSMLRSLHPTEEKIQQSLGSIKMVGHTLIKYYEYFVDPDKKWYHADDHINKFYQFLDDNQDAIIDVFVKNAIHKNSFSEKCWEFLISVFVVPFFLNKIFVSNIPANDASHPGNREKFEKMIFEIGKSLSQTEKN